MFSLIIIKLDISKLVMALMLGLWYAAAQCEIMRSFTWTKLCVLLGSKGPDESLLILLNLADLSDLQISSSSQIYLLIESSCSMRCN
jgi:hypothetical protein